MHVFPLALRLNNKKRRRTAQHHVGRWCASRTQILRYARLYPLRAPTQSDIHVYYAQLFPRRIMHMRYPVPARERTARTFFLSKKKCGLDFDERASVTGRTGGDGDAPEAPRSHREVFAFRVCERTQHKDGIMRIGIGTLSWAVLRDS
jgi:hypothetical protein